MKNGDGVRATTARREGTTIGWFVLLLLTFGATSLVAQEELTLAEAIRLARENNPNFLSTTNDQAAADWEVREAYGQLLPSVSAAGTAAFREAGVERVGTVSLQTASTDWYQSFYWLGFDWTLNGNTFYGISSARAGSEATQARVRAAAFDLQTGVTLQYMTVLRARDSEEVALETLERARRNLEIVRARVESGSVAGTDRTQAEVELGRAEVALLRAEQARRTATARLMEQLGVIVPEGVILVDEFNVFEPTWTLEELVADAMARHPMLRSRQATHDARQAVVRQAQSAYLPSLNLSTSLSGFAQQALNDDFILGQVEQGAFFDVLGCRRSNALAQSVQNGSELWSMQDCSQFAYTDAMGEQALARNDQFPFEFQKNPVQLNLTVSIPIFQGFTRQRQLEQASAQARDAEYDLRAEELRLRTAITESLDRVKFGWRSVDIEESNLELSRTQLEQARQRYQVGNTSILELKDAETSLRTAQRDYLNAVYAFHESLVALEAATGRSLRPEGTTNDDMDG